MASRKTKILWGLSGGLVLLLGLGLAFGGPRDESDRFAWDKVTRGDIRETISASGEIRAKTQINIGTTVAGEILRRHVEDGQDVKAGQLLVTLDSVRLRQGLEQAEAGLQAARKDEERLLAARDKARQTFARTESLFKQGLVSDEEYRQSKLNRDSAELTAQASKSTVEQARANAASARDTLQKTELRAPISGRVTSLKAERGEMAIPGMTNLPGATLMVVSDMSEVLAEVKVNESEVVRTRPGQPAQVAVESLPGRVFQAKVLEVASAAEKVGQDANTYKVKVALDMKNPDVGQLRPGMNARAVILTAEAKGILKVPLQAVLEREGNPEDAQKRGLLAPENRSVVFVAKNDRAAERTVKVGIASTQYFEVKEGLAEGEIVLTGPIRKLKEMKDRGPAKLKAKSDTELEKEARDRKGKKP
ncbi:MAG: efflux RND transporter periplasmic adaptor subunit [Acidobacteria bacterium]|nr:efflux RND transporter periplasmic adaptor subunit [Acidobacteriota bacterium]